ncbi:sensor histidine kinase [Zhihengliuella salsuginis]|uniref:Signal transduction histidine kinase subgroup 3 dimerisation and phosphoacceptor domain-containing protein n=1 Tax=Zhihengliuella salsuginis TaxID=578222 RepID=A0ABQ3GGL5_9MICC|nr:histidine kinase [Zhihengliuella salsuginis]GHD04057.1 hypothetical protein GCM10008096_10910 [Zhihengliuella salsuginis]
MDSDDQPKRSLAGLFYAGVWLVFLGFPLSSAIVGPSGPLWTGVAIGATAAFVAVYLWLFWTLSAPGDPVAHQGRRVVWGVVALSALAALAAPGAGAWVSAYTPFIAAALIFSLPLVPGIAAGTLVWLIPSAAAAQFSGTLWTLLGPGFGVAVIVFARLMEHNERRAQEAQHHLRIASEREEIARDVHDVLGHTLTVLSIKAQLARKLLDRDLDRARTELDAIDELARESLTQIRSTVTRLRTPSLADELESARTALRAAGITPDIDADPQLRDGSDLFAWAVREGVTNAVRHSSATTCRIEATATRLTISDDGAGCGGSGPGNGLTGLRERARDAGARLDVRPTHPDSPRPGTTLEVTR